MRDPIAHDFPHMDRKQISEMFGIIPPNAPLLSEIDSTSRLHQQWRGQCQPTGQRFHPILKYHQRMVCQGYEQENQSHVQIKG